MAASSWGLGLALGQRLLVFAPRTASSPCPECPMARVAHAIRRSAIIQAARSLQTQAARSLQTSGARLHAPRPTPPPKPFGSRARSIPSKPFGTSPCQQDKSLLARLGRKSPPTPSRPPPAGPADTIGGRPSILSSEAAPRARPPPPPPPPTSPTDRAARPIIPSSETAPRARPPPPTPTPSTDRATRPIISSFETAPRGRSAPARPPAVPSATVAAKLAARGRPTVLYEAASHFWLRLSSLNASLFCITFAVLAYSLIFWPAVPDQPWYDRTIHAVTCLLLAAVGYLLLVATKGIVRRITAVPTATLPATYRDPAKLNGKQVDADARALRALRASPVALQCEVGGLLPVLGDRVIIAAPSEVCASFRWAYTPVTRVTEHGPPPHSVFASVQRGLVGGGFLPILIQGQRYKVDILAGKIFEGGKPLDLLMPPDPTRFSETWLDRLLRR